MRIEAWPTRAQFRPGEPVTIAVRVEGCPPAGRVPLRARILALGEVVAEVDELAEVGADGGGAVVVPIHLPPLEPHPERSRGYAVELSTEQDPSVRATTAFDVAAHWAAAPRYGFFSDFGPEEDAADSARRAESMLKLHLNVVQFYDWMASHHTFLAASDEFVDPLGRRISHAVVRRKVEVAHERGMAALAYGALYGAEEAFSLARPDWLLYDGGGRPLHLADLFYLQDFTEASPWREWILDQYSQAMLTQGFDGIHIDQYGFPKRALSRATGAWREVDVGASFPGFVDAAAARVLALRPDGGSLFNCVNAWPLERMVRASADAATYIEVWEPHVSYRDLYDLVRRARTLRPAKQVILAAYLRPFHPDLARTSGALNAFRLAWAAINASGGFHLVAGEGDALLAEAYYPNHGHLDPSELAVVRRYADFVVRTTALLHAEPGPDIAWTHVGPTNDAIVLDHPALPGYGAGACPDALWVIGREDDDTTSLQLINLCGLTSTAWNVAQDLPAALDRIEIRARISAPIDGVWWDTPDDDVGVARPVDFEVVDDASGRFLVFHLPRVEFWSTVWWRRGAERS